MIRGLDKLNLQIERLCKEDLLVPTEKAISVVQEAAKNNVSVRTGELRGSIYTSVRTTENGIEGVCYINKEYAPYIEFGTGPAGEQNHKGISPDVSVAYRQTGWLIPASAMTPEEAEEYGFPAVKDKNGKIIGYSTRGQPARPYMYPALKDNRENILNEYKKYMQQKLGRLE